MKKKHSVTTIIGIATLFASCGHDQAPEIPATKGEVEVEMNITASTLSRARAHTADENNINNLSVLVFNASGNRPEENATFLYSRHAWLSGSNTYRTSLKTGTDLNIYFAANVENLISEAGAEEGDTYEEVRNKLILTNPDLITENNLPMWGIALGKNISESSGLVNLGTVNLLRSVASVDLEVTDNDFEFTNAYIVLATDKGYLTHKADDVSEVNNQPKIIAPLTPADAVYDYGNDYLWTHAPDENNAVVNKFYMFDNDATAATAPEKRYTKLIAAGKYNGGQTISYYSLSFRNGENEKVQVARNRKFELTVIKVNGPGYASLEEATNAEDADAVFDVIVWDGDDYESDIIIYGSEYVSFPGGKTVLLADQEGSDAHSRFSSNALVWNEGSPENFAWSFDDFETESTDNTISDTRFTVTITKEDDESFFLTVTALKSYNDITGGSHEAVLSIKIGHISFAIKLRQVENGWVEGSKLEVDL